MLNHTEYSRSSEELTSPYKAGTCKEITTGKRAWIAATSGCYMILEKKSSMEANYNHLASHHSLLLLRKSTRHCCYCWFLNYTN